MSTSPIEKFIEDLTEEQTTDLVLMVAQQDPTEMVNGKARWNSDQRSLISEAAEAIDAAGLDLPDSTR